MPIMQKMYQGQPGGMPDMSGMGGGMGEEGGAPEESSGSSGKKGPTVEEVD